MNSLTLTVWMLLGRRQWYVGLVLVVTVTTPPATPPQVLGEAASLITTHAKKGKFEEFGVAVDSTSQAVCQLTEAAAQVDHTLL